MENTQVDKKSFQNLNSGEVDVRRKILRHILDSFDSEKEQTRIKDLDNSSYHFINKMKEVMKRDLLNISMEIRESVDLLKYSQKSLEYFKVSGSKHVRELKKIHNSAIANHHVYTVHVKKSYRVNHVLYSILQGKKYNRIESSHSKGFDLNKFKEQVISAFDSYFSFLSERP